jgi:hypothetical protein
MTHDTFWRLIDEARNASPKLVDIPKRLIDTLSQHTEQDIVDFETHYVDCLHRAYDARLWLAAVVMMRGCGDDTFSDFRGWLIAQGQQRFESALLDPDSLADLQNFEGDDGRPTLFYFGSIAPRAFCKRASGDENDFDAQTRFESLCSLPEYPPLKNEQLINASDDETRTTLPTLAARFPVQ